MRMGRVVLMSTARALACITMVAAVIWYTSCIQHQLLAPPIRLATSSMDALTQQHASGSNLRPSTNYHPATTYSTLNDPANKTFQGPARKDWEAVMQERLARVAEVCKKYPKELMRFDLFGVSSSLTVDPIHHLVYCRNAKAGTTTWLSRLLIWAGVTLNDTSPDNIHRVANLVLPPMTPDIMELRRPTFAFTVARHPINRLVSAYRNKFQEKGNYKSHLWPKMIEKYNRGINNNTVLKNSRPTFREFVLFASDEVHQCLGSARPSCMQKVDVHWQPHHDRCAPCNIKYDLILKMETKDEDDAYLSQLLGLPLPTPVQENKAPSDTISSQAKSLFATLSQSERHHVFEAYKFDFLMFDYSYNDEDYT